MASVCRRRLWRERRRGQSQEGTWRFYPTTRRYTTSTTGHSSESGTEQSGARPAGGRIDRGRKGEREMRSHQARRRTTERKGGVATVVMALESGFGAVEFEETRRRRDAGSSSWRRFRGRGASLDLREGEGFPAATLVASPAEGVRCLRNLPGPLAWMGAPGVVRGRGGSWSWSGGSRSRLRVSLAAG